MTPLCSLALKYGTDKYSKHNYTKVYYDLFRNRLVKSILEIGIKRGASLRMWEEFFPMAKVFGIDIKESRLINAGRIRSFVGDQGKPDTLRAAATAATIDNMLDIIIDDGIHNAIYQATAAQALLPFLAKDGVYVIEDVKHGPRDNPKELIGKIPNEFSHSLILTNDMLDSGLLVIKRK